ncbi:MAG TPA: hypothetical protein VGP97_18520 [Burkholderiales bacterium]|jgi:hypothetical protein|nr:hypothetical protein [Burkholderiales bacterium]
MEPRKQVNAGADHDGPHDERAGDAPEERAALQVRRNAGLREDQPEDEPVVDGERLLERVSRKESDAGIGIVAPPEPRGESERDGNPCAAHDRGAAQARRSPGPCGQAVEGKQPEQRTDERCPIGIHGARIRRRD